MHLPARPRRLAALLAALASPLIVPTNLHPQGVRYVLVPAESRVWFDASATLGRFQGVAQQVSGWADVPDTVRYTGTRGEVNVGVAGLHTGIALRNQHLREELDAPRYPFIRFVLDSVGASGDAGRGMVLHGRLTVRGETHEVDIPSTAARTGGALVIDGTLPTRFTALGMKPPTRMAGMARVRDDFTIHFHAVFRRP